MNRTKVCCFTGHRPEALYLYDEDEYTVYGHIRSAVESSVLDGYTDFMCGGCRGGDFLFGEAVCDLKKEYPDIRLICVLPFSGQSEQWSGADRSRYADLLDSTDEVICLSDRYDPRCMHRRNRYMVDRSSLLIAAYNGTKGGTEYTLNYARKNGLRVVNVLVPPAEESEQLSFE